MIASEMENIFKVWGKCTSKSGKDQYSFLTEMRVPRSVNEIAKILHSFGNIEIMNRKNGEQYE